MTPWPRPLTDPRTLAGLIAAYTIAYHYLQLGSITYGGAWLIAATGLLSAAVYLHWSPPL